jgi:ABC-2 type transport system ATP-binding protein
MSEMALTADHLIVIGRGRMIADAGVDEVIRLSASTHVRVRSPQAAELAGVLGEHGGSATPSGPDEPDALSVTGLTTETIGDLAAANGLVLHELSLVQASLESAFMELTGEAVDFRAPTDPMPGGPS